MSSSLLIFFSCSVHFFNTIQYSVNLPFMILYFSAIQFPLRSFFHFSLIMFIFSFKTYLSFKVLVFFSVSAFSSWLFLLVIGSIFFFHYMCLFLLYAGHFEFYVLSAGCFLFFLKKCWTFFCQVVKLLRNQPWLFWEYFCLFVFVF